MRILQVHSRYRQAGGEDTVVAADSELLRSAGHDVREHFADNPVTPLGTGAALALSSWNPMAASALRKVVRHYRPDVAHVHNTWYASSPSVIEMLARCRVPVVTTIHNYRLVCANSILTRDERPCEDCVGRTPWPAVRHRCYRSSMVASAAAATTIAVQRRVGTWSRKVSVHLVLSAFAAERIAAAGLPPARLRVHPHFVPDPGPRSQPPSESQVVVFVGRLVPEKGVRIAMEAWRRSGPAGLKLVVVGEGPLEPELQAAAPRGVRLVGRMEKSELAELLSRARALLFPSLWYECQPMVLVEAMAHGLPVLSSDIGSIPELVGSDGWGVQLPPGDTDAWAAAIATLGDGAALDRAGEVGRRRYLGHHTARHTLASLEAAYDDAIAGGDRGGERLTRASGSVS